MHFPNRTELTCGALEGRFSLPLFDLFLLLQGSESHTGFSIWDYDVGWSHTYNAQILLLRHVPGPLFA